MITLLWLVLGCSVPAPPPSAPRPVGPSVLLVTLDTTRADRMGAYGHSEAHTPTFDALASAGLRFDRAYATAALTIPSHASIFTGRAPPSHGVRDNGDFVLGEEQITLAERLSAAGWHTAAFTAAFPTRRRWGLGQGFEVYHDPLAGLPDELDWSNERSAEEVVDDALATLPALAGPVFVWVHLFDPHWPYRPPEPWRSRLDDPYDGEIAYADDQLGRLMRDWDRWFPDSVVVVTADHGEGHGDGGELTHGFLLHDATIRVPLVLRAPGLAPGVIQQPVSHIDIAPTVLDLVGLPLHEELQGRDLRKGGSERPYQEALAGRYHLGLAELTGHTDGNGRYVRGAWGASYRAEGVEVGLQPVQPPLPGHAQAHDALLDALEPVNSTTAGLAAVEVEQLLALGYVGSIGGAPGGVDPRDVIDVIPDSWEARTDLAMGRLQDAARRISRLEERMPGAQGVRMLRGLWWMAAGHPDAATQVFTDLYLEAPSSAVALDLASLAERRGDLRDAEDWYRTALEHQVDSPEALLGLVRTAWLRGEVSEAGLRADEALARFPDHAEVGLLKAELALQDGRLDEAREDASDAVARMPFEARALSLFARVLWEQGEADRAIELQQEAIRIEPWAVPPRRLLAGWLLEVGRNAEAVRVLSPVVQAELDWPDVERLHREAVAAVSLERERARR